MTPFDLEVEYNNRKPFFERAIENFQQAILLFLKEKHIPFLNITGRLKDLDSFIEKVDRKKYLNPFSDNEDFCGIRIIVYYPNDISEVGKIIEREFDLQDSFDKADELEVNEFGYRSKHFIVKIKQEWLSAPNYRSLEDIKVEIQVRTVLMHAWAEIEHKLAYKNKSQIPKELQRQLFRLSAKFEESDEQFQDLKEEIERYREGIKENVKAKGTKSVQLNLDSLTALLEYYLPQYPNNRAATSSVLDDLINNKFTFEKVEDLLKNIKPYAGQINKEVFPDGPLRLTQATLLNYARDIFLGYSKGARYTESRKRIVEKFKNKLRKRS